MPRKSKIQIAIIIVREGISILQTLLFRCFLLFSSRLRSVMNYHDVIASVPDKAAAVDFLIQANILHTVQNCSNGHQMKLCLDDRQDRWRCHVRGCREEIGLRVGAWLEASFSLLEERAAFGRALAL